MNNYWIQKKLSDLDWGILAICLVLFTVGLIALNSATLESSGGYFGNNFHKQILWGLLGLTGLFAIYFLEKKVLFEWSYLIYGVVLVLLVLTLFFGTGAGSSRWFRLGPIQFQPSEFMKIALILALAKYLSSYRLNIQNPQTLAIPFLLTLFPTVIVFQQPDLGTAMVYIAILFPMLFWANVPLFYLFAILAPFVSIVTAFNFVTFAIWIGILLVVLYFSRRPLFLSVFHFIGNVSLGLVTPLLWSSLKEYQQTRILTLFDMSLDPQGSGYQVLQSQTAIGSGGMWGRGIGQGTQTHLKFLPEQHTDFIFSVVGEEMGFIVVAVLLVLFMLLLLRITYLASEARDKFSGMVLMGVGSLLFFHVAVNIAMTIGLMPVTGLPLPFFSYGGSFLVMSFAAIGLLLNSNSERIE
ncbi:MAG: rod shape-determining protein RodA [Candidatus Marinimicrobia bacterium]|nr:rod shape-determining protein RodA [Candidatus Neomarinimicrobiota bacterium]MCF7827685.1 rod shape-determining protein RodA [Candidatus Neomarinimicrobiota bacterium]MCF7881260.1 rod shape-determining protein RodA [Candidatus Neomarinimicrobiota bacterium]